MSLTIAYITARQQPRIEWFFESLARQIVLPRVIVIGPEPEYYADKFRETFERPLAIESEKENQWPEFLVATLPKPTVWSGRHRLTKRDFFSASNARNTAAALCRTDWIAYVDDLSLLGPMWFPSAVLAMLNDYIGLGTYQKVKEMRVMDGRVFNALSFEAGIDTRTKSEEFRRHQKHARFCFEPMPCAGSWLYGCSCVMPVAALEAINGWPENLCDGLGGEDYMTGIVLQNAGYKFKFDIALFTTESEDDHHRESMPQRWDPGASPHDKSHRALEIAMGAKHFDNDFGDGMTLRELRAHVLAGNPFPVRKTPEHEWFTGRRLEEL